MKQQITIENLYVGISRNNKIDRIMYLPTNKVVKEELGNSLLESYKYYLSNKNSIELFNKDKLIMEEMYYCELNSSLNLNNNLPTIVKVILKEGLSNNKTLRFVSSQRSNMDEKDKIRFVIIETEKEILFCYINSRTTIRDKKFFEVLLDKGTMKTGKVLEIEQGINMPDSISCIYNKNSKKFFVLDVNSFEAMFHIREKNKEKAKKVFDEFKSENYKLGIEKEEYSVKFNNPDKIMEEVFKKARYTSRLANYSPEANHPIERIQKANNQLPKEKQVEINEEKKIINVSAKNYKTFIAIIHNAIVERLISGDIEIVN